MAIGIAPKTGAILRETQEHGARRAERTNTLRSMATGGRPIATGAVDAAAAIGLRGGSCGWRDLRAVVADDDPASRLLLRRMLTDAGMETEDAADGEGALALVRSWDPDIVLLDWVMPEGGLGLVRQVVAEPGFHGRVIMLSTLEDVRDRRAALEAGAAHYVVKPPRADALIQVIRLVWAQRSDLVRAVA
jgi:two-component system chemotaxis response regulator CheY